MLATLLSTASHGIQDAANAAKCVSNLRQIQQLSLSWANDNDGWTPQATWYATNSLPVGSSNLRKIGLTDALIKCPSSKLKTPNYGISGRLVMSTPTWGPSDVYYWSRGQYKFSALAARTIIYAETGPLTTGSQTGAYISGVSLVAYPHNGHANVVFADGHVEALKPADLEVATAWTRGLPN